MPNTDTMAYLRLVGIRNLQTARDGIMRIEMSVMMLNKHVSRMLSAKSRHLPSVISEFQNFSIGEHMNMLTQKHAKFHDIMRTIKVHEAKYSSGSTILSGAKIRMYCRRMAVFTIDIAGLYRISFTQAHCYRVSLQSLIRPWTIRTNTTSFDCSSVMFH